MVQARHVYPAVSLLAAAAMVGLSSLPSRPAAARTTRVATVALTTPGGTYSEDFDTLAGSGSSGATPPGWLFAESGTGANTTYTAGTGSATTGDTYSFGSTAATDRAFGGLQTGSLATTIGAGFTNDTGGPLDGFEIGYTGEQWRLGNLGRIDRLDFQYSLDASSLTSGTWVDADSLDFTAPVSSGSVGALDGNDAANRTDVIFTLSGLSIGDGDSFWIRWTDFNATGSDDGLAIDDFALTPLAALATATDTPGATLTPTEPPTATSPSPSSTPTPSDTPTDTPTDTPSATSLPTDTPAASATPSPVATGALPVQLARFTATRVGRAVRLEWVTISEIKTVGFRLWREGPDGRLVQIGPALIPTRATELAGALYVHTDWAAPRPALRYWLDDVSTSGVATRHGPAAVPPARGRPLPLPLPTLWPPALVLQPAAVARPGERVEQSRPMAMAPR